MQAGNLRPAQRPVARRFEGRAAPADFVAEHVRLCRQPLARGVELAPLRKPKAGERVCRLTRDGHTQAFGLRDDSQAGAGSDVMVLEDHEPLCSRRCVDERGARFVAESFKQDLLRTGWTEPDQN